MEVYAVYLLHCLMQDHIPSISQKYMHSRVYHFFPTIALDVICKSILNIIARTIFIVSDNVLKNMFFISHRFFHNICLCSETFVRKWIKIVQWLFSIFICKYQDSYIYYDEKKFENKKKIQLL